jgi:invasion protein IalB
MLNKALVKQTLVAILALGAPTLADPPGARPRAFRDWRLDCAACAIHTSVNGADGSEVLRLEAGHMLVVRTPLPLFLPDGVALAFGDGPERVTPWRTCGAAGCEAALPLDPVLLEALRAERAGSATFTLVDGVQVRVPFSLLGFSAALRARGPIERPG